MPPRADTGSEPQSITVVSLLSALLRYRALIVVLALLGGFYAGYESLTSPRVYTTTASFMAQGARGQSQLSQLAQQFGITGGTEGQTSAFYMDLLESRSLLAAVGEREYRLWTPTGVRTGNIIAIYRIRAANPTVQKVKMVDALKAQVEENANPRTGVITVKVHAATADLAVQIARNVLDEVNKFNLNWRQAQAGAERTFVEKRLAEAQGELRQAEENLQSFLIENREFRSAPTLQLEFDRLNRAVTMRQGLYNGLAQAYETAKIEEVRDLPVITIIEPPEAPIAPDRHGGLKRTLVGMIVGIAIGMLLALAAYLQALLTRNRESDDFVEFSTLWRESMDDLKHPWRLFTRLVPRAQPS
jgi:uncharacterized protein involved in exopolysaccharide biosynthesis